MNRLALILASLCTISCATLAHATTIGPGTYYLDNAYVNGYAVTGTVTFNSSSVATGVSLSFLDTAYSSTPVLFTHINQSDTYTGLGQNYFTAANDGGGQVAIYFDNFTDANGNFDLCIGSAQCGTSAGYTAASTLQVYGYNVSGPPYYVPGFGATNFTSGYFSTASSTASLGTTAATPEPSSLVLLGTGLVGFAGAVRRRFQRA